MESILRYLLQIEGWVYFVCGSVLLISTIKAVIHAKKLRLAVFGLEQEVEKKKLRRYISLGICSLFLIVVVVFLVSFSMVRYPGINVLSTPTINFVLTPTSSASFGLPQQDVSLSADGIEEKCEAGKLEWKSPVDGEMVQGAVSLVGTVQVENFAFYRYSYRKSDEVEWTIIALGSQQVKEGALGSSWDTTGITPGEYQLGLFVFDVSNTLLPVCIIDVTIPFQ